jgi:FtsZ-binding cell division protein ZapB
MDYETERILKDKAEVWDVQNLKNEVHNLKSEINDLKSINEYWQGKFNNISRAMEELINLLSYKETEGVNENILQGIKQYLY